MSVFKIEINNYKSIKHCELTLSDINLLIGENGTGKTNVLDAIRYFYQNLLQEYDDTAIYNYQNHFSNEVSIAITFDFNHLKKISIKNQSRETDSDYQGYYAWISRRNRYETLHLQKIKNKPVRWNQNRKYRQNIFNLFPLYVVDAREVNLTDWGQLWDIIGDLMKVYQGKEAEIANDITAIKDNETYKLKNRFQKLSQAFSNANIQIRHFTPKQYASAISTLLFKGNIFEFKENKLDYMSNGTNAFNYTNLLIEILKLISEFKLKDPTVVLDEPEISLHHKLIDQLTLRIFSCNGAIRFIIASHSPRLLKNIIQLEQSNCTVLHVSADNRKSLVKPVRLFSQELDNRPRIVMTDQHANAYFSRYILSVEGTSETEVFSNPFLQELFPILRNIDVMEGMSNDIVQRIVSPRQRRFHTKFLLLVDMDKVLTKHTKSRITQKSDNKFDLSSKYFPSGDPFSERYLYTSDRTQQFMRRKRIEGLAERGHFHYWYPFLSSNDQNFNNMLSLIREYLLERNIFAVMTTIEGTLINYSNLDLFWTYYAAKRSAEPSFSQISAAYVTYLKNDRLNFMRLLHSGKSDFILNLDEIQKCNPSIDSKLYQLIERNRAKKTDGWMTDWLNHCLCSFVDIDSDNIDAFMQYSKKLSDPSVRFQAQDLFRHYFAELFDIIHIIQRELKNQ